jgi:hypothetical protein
VTADCIDPDTSRPMTTGPGNSGTLPQAISAASPSAALIFYGTLTPPDTGTETDASCGFPRRRLRYTTRTFKSRRLDSHQHVAVYGTAAFLNCTF